MIKVDFTGVSRITGSSRRWWLRNIITKTTDRDDILAPICNSLVEVAGVVVVVVVVITRGSGVRHA